MKLREWLFRHRMSVTSFAKVVKTGRVYIHHWMRGVKPSEQKMRRVREITNGEVDTFQDLLDEHLTKKK